MRRWIGYFLALGLSCASGAWAQSAFTNLDFESATLAPIPNDPFFVYLSPALPGWSGFSGTNQLGAVLYDSVFLDSAGISLLDSGYPYAGIGAMQGNYSVLLQSGYDLVGPSPPGTRVNASLSQTGLVPLGTKSLTFFANAYGQFSVSLGGANLNLLSLPVANHNYNEYKADVSVFVGQTNTLTFTALIGSAHEDDGHFYFDSVQFSSAPIPEPGASSLLLVGIVGLVFWAPKNRKTM